MLIFETISTLKYLLLIVNDCDKKRKPPKNPMIRGRSFGDTITSACYSIGIQPTLTCCGIVESIKVPEAKERTLRRYAYAVNNPFVSTSVLDGDAINRNFRLLKKETRQMSEDMAGDDVLTTRLGGTSLSLIVSKGLRYCHAL